MLTREMLIKLKQLKSLIFYLFLIPNKIRSYANENTVDTDFYIDIPTVTNLKEDISVVKNNTNTSVRA